MQQANIMNWTFTYETKQFESSCDPNGWYVIYNNVVLGSGERVGQVSVIYECAPTGIEPVISVHFETADGEPHKLSKDTIEYFQAVSMAISTPMDTSESPLKSSSAMDTS